jgi:hypothetical protein
MKRTLRGYVDDGKCGGAVGTYISQYGDIATQNLCYVIAQAGTVGNVKVDVQEIIEGLDGVNYLVGTKTKIS